jgi:outer membrane biosynthesis protein TonB
MVQAENAVRRWPWLLDPLVRAFAISLALHLVVLSTLEVGSRFDLWRYTPLVALARALGLVPDHVPTPLEEVKEAMAKRARENPDLPMVFVDVDPAQATPEPPKKTDYFSPVNSLAGNPDTSRDTGVPKLDGTQDKVLKTKDTLSRDPMVILPPPAPAPTAQVEPEPEPPEPNPPPPPKPAPKPAAPPGDLVMAKPGPNPVPEPPSDAGSEVSQPPKSERPRTLAAARAQQQAPGNQGALVGNKFKQEGGVKRFSVEASLDVRGVPYGSYYSRFVAAVQQCWHGLLEQQRYSLDRLGKVVLSFRLTYDGRITDLKVVESNVGDIYTMLCELAITKPAPYDKWPSDMRRMVGANHHDVQFTFYY